MDFNEAIQAMAKDARESARFLRVAKRAEKDAALAFMAERILAKKEEIIKINAKVLH